MVHIMKRFAGKLCRIILLQFELDTFRLAYGRDLIEGNLIYGFTYTILKMRQNKSFFEILLMNISICLEHTASYVRTVEHTASYVRTVDLHRCASGLMESRREKHRHFDMLDTCAIVSDT